jgi:ASC-1-like (ASCH) protein
MSDTAPSHQLNLRKPYLKLIADGITTVEVRVGYPKMRRIQAGHKLTFTSGGDTVVTRVKRVTEYNSFEALLDHEDAVGHRRRPL